MNNMDDFYIVAKYRGYDILKSSKQYFTFTFAKDCNISKKTFDMKHKVMEYIDQNILFDTGMEVKIRHSMYKGHTIFKMTEEENVTYTFELRPSVLSTFRFDSESDVKCWIDDMQE